MEPGVFRPRGGPRLAQRTHVSQRPHRLADGDYRGERRYFLTICTHQRRNHFTESKTVELVRLQFLRTFRAEPFAVVAYCFMPDHVHAVVEGKSEHANLARFVRLAKQQSGFLFVRQTGQRLWQSSYFDRTLQGQDAFTDAVRYLINNPVGARLVDSPSAYPYWGSDLYSREELLEFVSVESGPRV